MVPFSSSSTQNGGLSSCAVGYDAAYWFGFNGQEKDDEIKSNGNSLAFRYRMHDPRIGRFLSVDPLTRTYPWYTPYQFAGNSPIAFIDLDGLERVLAISFNGTGDGATNYRIGHLKVLNGEDISSQILTVDIADQIVNAFINASKEDDNGIGFVAIWGHGSPNNMWGHSTPMMSKDDLDLLKFAIKEGDVKFTSNAIVYIGNCNAGTDDSNGESFAQKIADMTEAQVIAGRTDEYGGSPSGRGSVAPESEVAGKSMKYTMVQPSYDSFFSFRKGKEPVSIGSKVEVANYLERGKQLPMSPIPSKRPNSLSPEGIKE